MPRMHILQQTGNNLYDVVVHATTPAGNNSAGVSWATALQNSGLAVSSLPIGNGPGQLAQSEANNITSGSVIETRFIWEDNPAWNNTERTADLNTRAQQAVDAALADYAAKLKYFGHTVT